MKKKIILRVCIETNTYFFYQIKAYKFEFLVQYNPTEEDSDLIDEDDSFSYSDSDSDLYDGSDHLFRNSLSEDYMDFLIEDDSTYNEECLLSFPESRQLKLTKKLQMYRMKIIKMQNIVENLSNQYYFKRELDLYRLEKMRQNEEKDRIRREKRREKVQKLKKIEKKMLERLENERRRMLMKETPKKVIDYSEIVDEPVEKSKKRRRSTSKKEESTTNKSPKITVKTTPVALKPLQTCEFEGCEETSLPLSKYCFCHILNDKDQMLFERCQYEDPSGKQCEYPIIKFSSPSLCQAHIDLSNKANEEKKRKDKANEKSNEKTQRVKNENKKDSMRRNIEPQLLNRIPEEGGIIAPHPGMFVFHNEHQTGTGIQPPYVIQHPIITQLGPVPVVNNPNPNFVRYGNGFYEFLPPPQ